MITDELNATLSTVDPEKATDISHKVAQFYEGMDLATSIVSLHILLKAYLNDAPPGMVIESHHLYAITFMDILKKGAKNDRSRTS